MHTGNSSWRVVRRALLPSGVLAISIAGPIAGFTLMSALWFKPLPVPNMDRLVVVMSAQGGALADALSIDFPEEADRWSVFEDAAGQVVTHGELGGVRPAIVLRDVGKEVETLAVTSRYFRVLGVPIRGRDFSRADNRIGAEPVAVISDRLWSAAFRRDPTIIGASVPATPFAMRIVGIAPPGFTGARRGERADIWIPANLTSRVSAVKDIPEDALPTLVIARLKAGQSAGDATRELRARASTESERSLMALVQLAPLMTSFGAPDTKTTVISESLAMTVVGMLAAFVLLTGCTTLMSLTLVNYERRRREFQVRAAIGASRRQIVWLLGRELAVPAVLGSVGGLLLAMWAVRVLPALRLPGGVQLTRLDMSLDWRILTMAVVTGAVTLFTAASVAFMRFSQRNTTPDLLSSKGVSSRSSHRLRQWLLGSHVFVTSLVLLTAGLFIQFVTVAFDRGAGFDVDRTVFVDAQVIPPMFGQVSNLTDLRALREARRQRLEDGLRSLPGISEVASGAPPIGPASLRVSRLTFETEKVHPDLAVGVMTGSAELTRALGLPLIQGRHLQLEDKGVRPQRILLTEHLARRLWPAGDPIGKVVAQTSSRGRSTSVVVGIISDVPHESIAVPIDGVLVNVSPLPNQSRYVVRTEQPRAIVPAIERLIREVAPDGPLIRITTGRQLVADDVGRQMLGAWFLSGAGIASLILGAGGVFGLVAYLADSRRRDYAVRIALGGSTVSVRLAAGMAGIAPVLIGAAAGAMCASGLAGTIRSLLPGVPQADPLTYATVSFLLVFAASVAGLVGAGRLRTLSPADVLRVE
jgi:putative ABC transport system permease protein